MRSEAEPVSSDSLHRAPGLHDELDHRIVKNSLWVGFSYGGSQVLAMISMLVLVRLLTPSAFGVVALGMTLLGVLGYIQESGVGSALVYFREDPRRTAASALVFSVLSGAALALGVFLAAPLYAHFVRTPAVTDIVRGLALVLLLRGVIVVPNAILERGLAFNLKARSELLGSVMLAVVSISCALAGLGAWSLVFGRVASSAAQATALWLLVPWRPRVRDASRAALRTMLRYGRSVSAANLLNVLNLSMDNLSVGRLLGSSALGVYALGYRLAELPNTVIGVILGRAMFSVYSTIQSDVVALRHAYVENLRRTLLFALPVTVGLAIAADPVVPALLGEQWTAAVTPVRILTVFGLVRLVAAPSGELFKGIGRPHLTLIAATSFFTLALTSLVVLVPAFGINGAATAMVIAGVISGTIAIVIVNRVLELSAGDLARAASRPALVCLPVAIVLIALLPIATSVPPWTGLAIDVIAGGTVYAASVALLGRSLVMPFWIALRRGTAG